jgi:hypothetical protein
LKSNFVTYSLERQGFFQLLANSGSHSAQGKAGILCIFLCSLAGRCHHLGLKADRLI